jgi:hypothetical protein
LEEERVICTPNDVLLGQVIRVVVKYLTEHPEELRNDKLDLVKQALQASWPCTKQWTIDRVLHPVIVRGAADGVDSELELRAGTHSHR